MLSQFKAFLYQKKYLTDNVCLFSFKLKDKSLDFIPGQYLMLKINDKSRLYSIASSNKNKNQFELLIELVEGGLASTYLKNLNQEDEVIFYGPAGQFTLKNNDFKKIFLITGTGIAPIRSMLLSNSQFLKDNSYLFWGFPYLKDVYLLDEFKQFNLKICLSREKDLSMIKDEDKKYFALGHVDEVMFDQFKNEDLNNFEFYLCGGRVIVESLKEKLLAKNIANEKIIFEKF